MLAHVGRRVHRSPNKRAPADRIQSSMIREIRVDADQNAYHLGEFAIMRQIMGTGPRGHE